MFYHSKWIKTGGQFSLLLLLLNPQHPFLLYFVAQTVPNSMTSNTEQNAVAHYYRLYIDLANIRSKNKVVNGLADCLSEQKEQRRKRNVDEKRHADSEKKPDLKVSFLSI